MFSRAYIIICMVMLSLASPGRSCGEHRYRLHLDGKPGSDAVQLSERSRQRRERQGIPLDSTDLPVSPLYLAQLREAGLSVVTSSRWLNTVVVMRRDGGKVDDAQWATMPFVRRIDHITTIQRATAPKHGIQPDDTPAATVTNVAEDCTSPLSQVNAFGPLYASGYRGADMLITVLDAGFRKVDEWSWLGQHVIGTRDLYAQREEDSQLYTADTHGTCCLSILVSPREHGVCGTAQDADYYLIRTETLDSETELEEDMWVAGAEQADSIGADVISSSLGYYEFDGSLAQHTQEEMAQYTTQISRGARVACQKGMLVCNAAGNEGNKTWQRLLFPADVEDVLTVGGIGAGGNVSSFSSRGFTTPYIKPDVTARAQQCYIVNANSTNGSPLMTGAGTSYATPLIAGLCASLWSAVPGLTAHQLREAVRQSASHYLDPDSIHGYGTPDFGEALRLARLWTDGRESIESVRTDGSRRTMRFTPTGRAAGVKEEKGLMIEGGKVILRR